MRRSVVSRACAGWNAARQSGMPKLSSRERSAWASTHVGGDAQPRPLCVESACDKRPIAVLVRDRCRGQGPLNAKRGIIEARAARCARGIEFRGHVENFGVVLERLVS